MTVDVTTLKTRLRASADTAALASANYRATGNNTDADFHAGRQAGLLAALATLDELEDEAATERDEAFGEGVNLAAVARLESFAAGRDNFTHSVGDVGLHRGYGDYATETGALDQASGTVYSDADGGL